MAASNALLSKKEVDWAEKMCNRGFTKAEVARKLFVCTRTVQRSLKGRSRHKISIEEAELTERKAAAWDELVKALTEEREKLEQNGPSLSNITRKNVIENVLVIAGKVFEEAEV